MTVDSDQTIVLGAGPAGLAAAFELARRGRSVRVVERAEVVGAFAVRSPRAYPDYRLGYPAPLGVLKAYAGTFANLQLIGRGGAFRYNNTDHAIESGLLAARNVLGDRHDLESVNATAEYLKARRQAGASGPSTPAARLAAHRG